MRARPCLALLALALLALPLAGARPAVAAPGTLALEAPSDIDALLAVDVDGDGLADVVTLSGRTVCVWTGSKGALPAAAPRWRVELPSEVSFVDVAREERPSLLALGDRGAVRLPLGAATASPVPLAGTAALGWRDGQKAVFAPLHPGPAPDPSCALPTLEGWCVRTQGGVRHVLSAWREVGAAGPFLEDTASAKSGLPVLFTTGKPVAIGSTPAAHLYWSLAGNRLTCLGGPGEVAYDLSFLPGGSRVRLVDLDGDGRPELATGEGDNREVRYAFFRVPGPEIEAGPGGAVAFRPVGRDLRPPAAFLRLSGFNLEPEVVDLDGDGLLDFVQTTIAVDHQNTVRAMMTGKVTASTLAFLQRRPAGDAALFPSEPDATVLSDIWVRLRFSHAGTLDVARSFTILATGDLDGDGRRDLVVRTGPGTLAVRAGTAQGVWAKEARTVEIPPLAAGEELEATAADLDGRPGDELLLLYRAPAGQPDQLLLVR